MRLVPLKIIGIRISRLECIDFFNMGFPTSKILTELSLITNMKAFNRSGYRVNGGIGLMGV